MRMVRLAGESSTDLCLKLRAGGIGTGGRLRRRRKWDWFTTLEIDRFQRSHDPGNDLLSPSPKSVKKPKETTILGAGDRIAMMGKRPTYGSESAWRRRSGGGRPK